MKINIKVAEPTVAVNPLGSSAPAAKAPGFGEDHGGHYYGHTNGVWHPLYQENKDFTLREARKVQAAGGIAVPSVTTIISCLAKPQLERWKMTQAAEAMYEQRSLRSNAPTKEDAIDNAVNTASGAARGAADLGSRIHKGIEMAVMAQEYDASLDPYVKPVMAERFKRSIVMSTPEECLGSMKYGYAGRCDDNADTKYSPMTIIDYKSRKSKGKKVASYETDAMQIAAYGYAKWGNDFFKKGRGLIFAISTTQPGLLTVHEYTGLELVEAFKAFLALCDVWRYQNKYDARTPASNPTVSAQDPIAAAMGLQQAMGKYVRQQAASQILNVTA